MNYIEWAEEYDKNALRVQSVIERKKQQMNEDLTADEKKKLCDDIAAYRRIWRELTDIGATLRSRAGVKHLDA